MCDHEMFEFDKLDELYNQEDKGYHYINDRFLPYIAQVKIKNNLIIKNDMKRAAPATLTLIEDDFNTIKNNVVVGVKYKVWVGTTLVHLISTFGNKLAMKEFGEHYNKACDVDDSKMPDFAAIYTYDHWKDSWKYSLRSIAPFDVSNFNFAESNFEKLQVPLG